MARKTSAAPSVSSRQKIQLSDAEVQLLSAISGKQFIQRRMGGRQSAFVVEPQKKGDNIQVARAPIAVVNGLEARGFLVNTSNDGILQCLTLTVEGKKARVSANRRTAASA